MYNNDLLKLSKLCQHRVSEMQPDNKGEKDSYANLAVDVVK